MLAGTRQIGRVDASPKKMTDLVEDTGGTDDDVPERTGTGAAYHDRVVAADYLAVFCPAAGGLGRRARTGHCVGPCWS
jgi:hypothetical protein